MWGRYQYWDLTEPPPPIDVGEDPRVEYNSPIWDPDLVNSGRFIDEITGFGMMSSEAGEQDGRVKNINDYGSWEQRPSYQGVPSPSWQTKPFGGTSDE